MYLLYNKQKNDKKFNFLEIKKMNNNPFNNPIITAQNKIYGNTITPVSSFVSCPNYKPPVYAPPPPVYKSPNPVCDFIFGSSHTDPNYGKRPY